MPEILPILNHFLIWLLNVNLRVVFVIAIIVVVPIFILWFLPKALKDWNVASRSQAQVTLTS